MDKFGSVYSFRNSLETSTHLASACFSNLDLKWYNLAGEIHKESKSFSDSDVHIVLDVQHEDKHGKVLKTRCDILLPATLGELSQDVTKEYLSFARKEEMALAEELKLYDTNDPYVTQRVSQMLGFTAFIKPGTQLLKSSPLLVYLATGNYLEEFLALTDLEGDATTRIMNFSKTLSYGKTVQYCSKSLGELKGQKEGYAQGLMTNISGVLEVSNLGLKDIVALRKSLKASNVLCQRIRKESLNLGKTEESIEPLIKSLITELDARSLQACKQWNEKLMDSQSVLELNEITVGVLPIIEAVALQLGIELGDEIRDSFLFKKYCQLVVRWCSKVKDLINVKSVSKVNCIMNEVYIVHEIDKQSFEDALKQVNEAANRTALKVVEHGTLLADCFERDENVTSYIRIAKDVMVGFVHSSCYLNRFQTDFKMDCYVKC